VDWGEGVGSVNEVRDTAVGKAPNIKSPKRKHVFDERIMNATKSHHTRGGGKGYKLSIGYQLPTQ